MPSGRSPISFLQAILAFVLTLLFVLAYLVADSYLDEGWFRSFLIAAIPGAAVVSGAYCAAYFVLAGHGLTRDQQLAKNVAERVSGLLGTPAVVEGVFFDTAEPDWDSLLADANHVLIAARSLSRWSSNLDATLRSYFEMGGTMEIYSHDPDAADNMELVAASHAGYGPDRDPDRVRGNITSGLRRIVRASEQGNDTAVRVWQNNAPEFTFPYSLFAFFDGEQLVRAVLRPNEIVRAGVTSTPSFVLRADAQGSLAAFVAREQDGLTRLFQEVGLDDVRAQH